MISRSPTNTFVYGFASLLDGIVMILSLGLLLSQFRGRTSMWMARRSR